MRHKRIQKRRIDSDPEYKNISVSKFINSLMKDGKKSVARKVFYETFEIIKKKNEDPISAFDKALNNVGPRQEVKARRVGGASYQVP
ncbi:MAG: 30S ribosomal protein S7, partial [Patescibacteria group bacterium]|nr:30S ribosomal protein S7 [Patescibacteria group bacterium]